MHRAAATVQIECEWKPGERVDFRFRLNAAKKWSDHFWMKFFTGASGKQKNGKAKGRERRQKGISVFN